MAAQKGVERAFLRAVIPGNLVGEFAPRRQRLSIFEPSVGASIGPGFAGGVVADVGSSPRTDLLQSRYDFGILLGYIGCFAQVFFQVVEFQAGNMLPLSLDERVAAKMQLPVTRSNGCQVA